MVLPRLPKLTKPGLSPEAKLASGAQARSPLPGLSASAARPLPRWLLIFVFAAFALTGILGRAPWKGDELTAIALAQSSAQQPLALSLLPNLSGQLMPRQGPLNSGLGGLLIQAQLVPSDRVGDLLRCLQALCLGLGLWTLWSATRRLALRTEARPLDPLGIGPDAASFGRTLGDCAVFTALAALGGLVRWHEAAGFGLSFLLQASLVLAMAHAPEAPKRSGAALGVLSLLVLWTDGLALLLPNLLGIALACQFSLPWRLVWRRLMASIGLALLLGVSAWSALVWPQPDAQALMLGWWQSQFQLQPSSPWVLLKAWAWTWWPLWPMVLAVLVYGWRSRFWPPHLLMLLAMLLPLVLAGLLGLSDQDGRKLMPIAWMASLSAFGLLTLGRRLVNLIDWAALVIFTALGVMIWLYWSANYFGVPPNLAARIDFFAPGISKTLPSLPDLILGVGVSLVWLGLVLWRAGRGASRLWRPVALSMGGLVLAWMLSISLWLPAIEAYRGYGQAPMAMTERLAQARKNRPIPKGRQDCITTPVGDAEAKAFLLALTPHAAAFQLELPGLMGDAGLIREGSCTWVFTSRLIALDQRQALGAELVWSGRPARDRAPEDRLRLYWLGKPRN